MGSKDLDKDLMENPAWLHNTGVVKGLGLESYGEEPDASLRTPEVRYRYCGIVVVPGGPVLEDPASQSPEGVM